jgi:peptidoglycan/LPS O-acetylase OafA/YrhL
LANRTPLFLAKSGYRSRRLSDAARLLPVLGLFLLMLPAFWATPGKDQISQAEVGVYIFLVWAGLILAAALLSRLLPKRDPREAPPRDLL